MGDPSRDDLGRKLKNLVIGERINPFDRHVFHKLSLIAFFAWIGLGVDGMSSACYGPAEAFLALGQHVHLGIFVGLATIVTIFVIVESYIQIIELFPSGGGGYLVASKLLTPHLGMVSGCALLIDYVLTITVSVASGTDALFSMLPERFIPYKLTVAVIGVVVLAIMNLRGVRESVLPLVPIFLIFILTHVFTIVYSLVIKAPEYGQIYHRTVSDIHSAGGELGLLGTFLLVLRAYSMGAGTFTGIEAVSNGLPLLREPRVQTAKRTMTYMGFSLGFMALGLMVAYIVLGLKFQPDKTLNAVLFENMTQHWPSQLRWGFTSVTLLSEAAILFVAAQTGFLGGPRVLSNMAMDRWFPGRFTVLSDRLVTHNGILMMALAGVIAMLVCNGSVTLLVVLYSINVFITFSLSQLGMVRHWWMVRKQGIPKWHRKITIATIGLVLCVFILISVSAVKFTEGGWATLVVTGSLALVALAIRRHYSRTHQELRRLDDLVAVAQSTQALPATAAPAPYNPNARTAVLLVSGFNGLGLHTLFTIIRLFGDTFRNLVFIRVGQIDAGNFKGIEEIDRLRQETQVDLDKYVEYCRHNGYYAESFASVGVDIVEEISNLAPRVLERFPNAIFFGGQLVFTHESIWTRLLHNYMVFAVQRRFYTQGAPFVILPIRV